MSDHLRFEFLNENSKECNKLYSLEDLYDLTMSDLDKMYRQYHKVYEGEGLLEKEVASDTFKQKLDAIKHVFKFKEEQNQKHKEFQTSQEIKQKLKTALENTKLSSEDVEKMMHEF